MLEKITLTIDGKPRGKERAKAGKFGFFTPDRTVDDEANIRALGSKAMAGRRPSVGPFKMHLEAVFEVPDGWPSRVKEMSSLPHLSAPDLDNIEKLVLDGLNEIVFVDDRQVFEVHKRKRYGEPARIEVVLEEVSTTEDHPILKAARRRQREGVVKEKVERRTTRKRRAPKKIEAKEPARLSKRIK